jgi:hypothetical protein
LPSVASKRLNSFSKWVSCSVNQSERTLNEATYVINVHLHLICF